MPVRITPFKSFTTTKQPLANMLRGSLYNMAAQLQKPSTQGIVDSASAPRGQKKGDTTIRYTPTGAIEVSIYDHNGVPATSIIAADANSNVSFQTGTAPPALVNFPTDGSNGQYYDTVLQQLWLVRNYQGTLIYPNFVSFSGTISDAQHGNRSTTTTVMHKFSQISGSITAAQHGDFAAATANDALHAPADSSHPGFMSIGQFNLLAGATDAATANTLVKRNGSGDADFNLCTAVTFNATGQYRVDNVRVVTNRQTGWTAWTGTASRATHATYGPVTLTTPPTQAELQAMSTAITQLSQAFKGLGDDLGDTAGHGLIDW